MKTILAYLKTNKMLGNPEGVPKDLNPMFYIGLDRDFEIDIRAKINKEIEDYNKLEKEKAELKEAAREMLDLLVQNAPIEGLYLSSIDEWNCLIG